MLGFFLSHFKVDLSFVVWMLRRFHEECHQLRLTRYMYILTY